MGKASRRARQAGQRTPSSIPAPFVARPFDGLPGESDWVALREVVPAATAVVQLRADAPAVAQVLGERANLQVTVATMLPGAVPALHRADGAILLGLQSGSTSGDASRDVASVLLAALASRAGTPISAGTPATAATPRLQDLLDLTAPFEVSVHEGFDYWLTEEAAATEEAQAAVTQANEVIVPTVKMAAAPSAYWCRAGERVYLRWFLPHDEDAATNALARLHAAGTDTLGEETRLLGAFRASGLLAPVWELDPANEADSYEKPLTELAKRLTKALSAKQPLDATQRRAKAGLLSRQVTLR